MSDGWVVLFVVGLPIALGLGVYFGALMWLWVADLRATRSDLAETRARIRAREGLPDHPRCGCAECIAWRAKPTNVARLSQ